MLPLTAAGVRPEVTWLSYGDSSFDVKYIYSPEEGLARNAGNPTTCSR